MEKLFKGIVPAALTPMNADGSLNPNMIRSMVEFMIDQGVAGFFVCGTTGEGFQLTSAERKVVAEHYVTAVDGRLPVLVQVGHTCLGEAQELARHAKAIGAQAIAARPPFMPKISANGQLVAFMRELSRAASGLPFYFYHFAKTEPVAYDVVEFLRLGAKHIPDLAGLKFSSPALFELQTCAEFSSGCFNVMFGGDEMLLSGLMAGADGSIGAMLNTRPGLFRKIFDLFNAGRLEEARGLQTRAVKLFRLMSRYGGIPAFKAAMTFYGLDCGPVRLPRQSLTPQELEQMKTELQQMGFFEW